MYIFGHHNPLGDALGSVRQITDLASDVMLAQGYKPFGSVLSTTGDVNTNYGFTGEWTDGTGLVHLRARYYTQGRFLSKDIWDGDPNQPMSYNTWLYVFANPINSVDPSGLYVEDEPCERLAAEGDIACRAQILQVRVDEFKSKIPSQTEKEPPLYITWDPSVYVPPALILDDSGRSIESENYAQKHICQCTGACGIGALAAIFRTKSGITANELFIHAGTLNHPSTDKPVTPNYTYAWELQVIVKDRPWWAVSIKNLTSQSGAASVTRKSLQQHRFPVAGVQIDGGTGRIQKGVGHWVVISAVSSQEQWSRGSMWRWLRILNPFDNDVEYYPWDYFWGLSYLETPSKHTVVEVWWTGGKGPSEN